MEKDLSKYDVKKVEKVTLTKEERAYVRAELSKRNFAESVIRNMIDIYEENSEGKDFGEIGDERNIPALRAKQVCVTIRRILLAMKKEAK